MLSLNLRMSALYLLAVQVTLLEYVNSDPQYCRDNPLGDMLRVNATCHLNGTVEFAAEVIQIQVYGFQIDYICTGNTQQEGIAFGYAYNGRIERGSFSVENWNYYNSTCLFYGCYDEAQPPFSTYNTSGVACTVITPSVTVSASHSSSEIMSVSRTTLSVLLETPSVLLETPSVLLETPLLTNTVQYDNQRIKYIAAIAVTTIVILFIMVSLPMSIIILLKKPLWKTYSLRRDIMDHHHEIGDQDIECSNDLFKCTIRIGESLITLTQHLEYTKEKGGEKVGENNDVSIFEDEVYECYACPPSTTTQEYIEFNDRFGSPGPSDMSTGFTFDSLSGHSTVSTSDLSVALYDGSDESSSISSSENETDMTTASYKDTGSPQEGKIVPMLHHQTEEREVESHKLPQRIRPDKVVEDKHTEDQSYSRQCCYSLDDSRGLSSDSGYLKCLKCDVTMDEPPPP